MIGGNDRQSPPLQYGQTRQGTVAVNPQIQSSDIKALLRAPWARTR